MATRFFRLTSILLAAIAVISTAAFHASNPGKTEPPVRRIEAHLRGGTLTADVSWVVDPETSADVLRGRIEYLPRARARSSCPSIRFVQVAKVEVSNGHDYDWQSGETNRNLIRTKSDPVSRIEAGYYVDHQAFRCVKGLPCSPYFRDYWANGDESHDGFERGRDLASASLVDYPFGWESLEEIKLESCARCAETGEYLGCARWGGKWPPVGAREVLPIAAQEAPSPTFLEAMHQFEAFYSALIPSGRQPAIR